jgi:hypothetical protein
VKEEILVSFSLQRRLEHIIEFSSAAIRGICKNKNIVGS